MSKQALEGSRLNAFGMDPDKLTIIGLDTDDGPEHPLYDQRIKLPLRASFVDSVRRHGILEPIKVRKNGDRVEVVFGRQRVRAARHLNAGLGKRDVRVLVPAMVQRGEDKQLFGASIAENEHRVADDVLTKSRKLVRYLALGYSEANAADEFGVTVPTIKSWLKLQDLALPVQQAVADGQLEATQAAELAALSRVDQVVELEKLLAAGPATNGHALSTATVRNAVRARTGQAPIDRPSRSALKKVLKAFKAEELDLPDGFETCLLWVLEGKWPHKIPGLRKATEG